MVVRDDSATAVPVQKCHSKQKYPGGAEDARDEDGVTLTLTLTLKSTLTTN